VVYFSFHGRRTARAEAASARAPERAAPLRWRSAFRSTFAGLVRRRALALHDAARIVREAEARMSGREYAGPSGDALERAARSRCVAYDRALVALDRDLGVRLVTADRHVPAAFPSTTVALDGFAGVAP